MPQPARRIARSSRDRATARRSGARGPARRGTQRERLIDALVQLSGQQGYQNISIAQISSQAGVSSATFYEQFADKEECLLAAYRAVAERALARMQGRLEESEDWSQAARGAFEELLDSVQEDPEGGRVMFVEVQAGGPRLWEELSRVSEGIEQRGEALLDGVPAGGVTLDLPARALMGAVRSIVARHLRLYSEDRLPELTDDMLRWMGSYGVPSGEGRWSTSEEAVLPASAVRGGARAGASLAQAAAPELDRLPRGRHGLPSSVVARSQRTRIVYATARVTMEKGYANATVADVVSVAGVAKEAFYRHFRDKEEAFLEAQQYGSAFVFDELVHAFFSVEGWPRRFWLALERLLALIAENPLLAHLRFVESYAAGATAIRRAEDVARTFTVFLEEGYAQRPQARELPRLCSQAIAGAIFELIQREVADGRVARLPERLPQLAYVAIAPFAGPREAAELVMGMASEGAAAGS